MIAALNNTCELKRETHKWFSPHLQRDMELEVIGHGGARVLFFPSRSGRFSDFYSWNMHKYIYDKIANGWLQIFCVDSVDAESMYCWWAEPAGRIKRHIQYETYIIEEVLPLTRKLNSNMMMISAGYSMGAFHAMNIALRHPQHFGRILSMSGRYSLTDEVPGFKDLFDGVINEDIYFNNPTHYLPNMSEGQMLSQIRNLDIKFVIGKEDPFYFNNVYLSEVMDQKCIFHNRIDWDGHAHTGYYWRRMLSYYL